MPSVEGKAERIVCFWVPNVNLLMSMVICDSQGENQKMLDVNGILEVFEALESALGEIYTVTPLTLFCMLNAFGPANSEALI